MVKPSKENPIESKMISLEKCQKILTTEKGFIKEVAKSKEQIDDLFTGLRISISTT